MKTLFIRLSIIFSLLLLVGVMLIAPWNLSLKKIQSGIEKWHQNVQHIDAVRLSEMDADNVVIFDVREPDEFNVSHIKGAIQISPTIEPEDFEYEFAEIITGKVVVFYCSVGVRSSAKASQLTGIVNDVNAQASYNLKGGIFQWHNELRPLVNKEGRTTKIHPYNHYWRQLIKDKPSTSYH